MENATMLKGTILGGVGAIGSFIASLFGGWSTDLQTLIIFMVIDFAMGLILAAVFKNSTKSETGALESKAGWKGLCRKCATLLFVLIAHRLDLAMGVDYIRTAAIIGFIVIDAISIVENAGLMGVPLPAIITKAIDVLKNKGESEGAK